MSKHLTEATLGEALKKIFPNEEFVHDKVIPGSNCSKRLDYRCENLKLIVEFDGDKHYCNATRNKKDEEKDLIFKNMGYTIVRIPYFVQLSTATIQQLFGIEMPWEQEFPHGFITTEYLPASMCSLGINRFLSDLKRFSCIKSDIIASLNKQYEKYGDWEYVLPIGMSLESL